MPRSENRRTIEVSAQLYDELKAEADREGVTMAALLRGLVTDGRSVQEWYGQIAGEIAEMKRELRRLADSLSK